MKAKIQFWLQKCLENQNSNLMALSFSELVVAETKWENFAIRQLIATEWNPKWNMTF